MADVYFVTYASGPYKKNISINKFFVDLFIRPKQSNYYTDEDLRKTDVYSKNQKIFGANVGAGYWAWKPWCILQAFEQAKEGDVLLYQDCGSGFKYKNFVKPKALVDYALLHNAMPGVMIPIHGKNYKWTHKKCFTLMDCDSDKFKESCQVEAAVSAWKVNDYTKKFLEEWLSCCLNFDIISDSEDSAQEHPEFVFHRYDQSVLTNLVYKYELMPVETSFNDLHCTKSLSLVSLDLDKNSRFSHLLLKFVLVTMRMKRKIIDYIRQ